MKKELFDNSERNQVLIKGIRKVSHFFYGYEWRVPEFNKTHLIKKYLQKEMMINLLNVLIEAL